MPRFENCWVMLGNYKILQYNAFYGCAVRENAYGIHSRTRWPHLACVTNIWPSSLRDSGQMLVTYARWGHLALEWMPFAYINNNAYCPFCMTRQNTNHSQHSCQSIMLTTFVSINNAYNIQGTFKQYNNHNNWLYYEYTKVYIGVQYTYSIITCTVVHGHTHEGKL